MKIVIITGSAHKHGTTATLTDQFQRGAADAGHESSASMRRSKTCTPASAATSASAPVSAHSRLTT